MWDVFYKPSVTFLQWQYILWTLWSTEIINHTHWPTPHETQSTTGQAPAIPAQKRRCNSQL